MNSPEYTAALAAATSATIKYSAAKHAYRYRVIDDAAFLAARAEWIESDKAFDAAFAAEESRNQEA